MMWEWRRQLKIGAGLSPISAAHVFLRVKFTLASRKSVQGLCCTPTTLICGVIYNVTKGTMFQAWSASQVRTSRCCCYIWAVMKLGWLLVCFQWMNTPILHLAQHNNSEHGQRNESIDRKANLATWDCHHCQGVTIACCWLFLQCLHFDDRTKLIILDGYQKVSYKITEQCLLVI